VGCAWTACLTLQALSPGTDLAIAQTLPGPLDRPWSFLAWVEELALRIEPCRALADDGAVIAPCMVRAMTWRPRPEIQCKLSSLHASHCLCLTIAKMAESMQRPLAACIRRVGRRARHSLYRMPERRMAAIGTHLADDCRWRPRQGLGHAVAVAVGQG